MQDTRVYRRCHVCGQTCEAESPLSRCSECGKSFAPFFYFDDKFTPVLTEWGLRPPDIQGQWRPIHGLTAYWQTD